MDISVSPSALRGTACAPTSKSVAHRMLICAALADESSKIIINAGSRDIEATVNCLRSIGAKIDIDGAVYTVTPPKEFPEKAELDCGESGSTLRFMLPVVSALGIDATLTGHGRLPVRPVEPLLGEMCKNGVVSDGTFPIHVKGKLRGGNYKIAGNISSQFITGLLLALMRCESESTIELIPPIESKPYIDITVSVLRQFGVEVEESGNIYTIIPTVPKSGRFTAEGDWSNAAFWLAAGVGVSGLNINSVQGDKKILDVLRKFGAEVSVTENEVRARVDNLTAAEIDAADIPDLVPIISVLAATADGTTRICNAARLRIKESDRIKTTAKLLRNLGGEVEETDDGLIITGKKMLNGGTVDGSGDHRIVMSAAIAAQKCTSPVTVTGAEAAEKSYPLFFDEYTKLGGVSNVMQLR